MPAEGATAPVLEGVMQVQAVGSTTIHVPRSLTDASTVPLNIFDKFTYNFHVGVIYAFAPPTASNATIKDGLVKALSHFPTLTGRLGHDNLGRPCIHVGGRGGGVLLVEATVATDLVDHLPLEPSPELLRLHPPTEAAQHVFQIQLNRFRCGGLVVGATSHHRIADGLSMSNFFAAWGKCVRGLPIDPLPIFDCSKWLQPRSPPRCVFQHWGVEFAPPGYAMSNNHSSPPSPPCVEEIRNIRLHYSSEFIQKSLKAQMREKYTTFESLLAHIWRKITLARGLAGEQITKINVAVNGRRRLKPPVPIEFFGNLVLDAVPRATARALLEGGVEGAARLIHDAVCRVDDEYFRSFADFGAMHEGEDLRPIYDVEGLVSYPNLEADSWLGFRFNDLDFGGGGACAFTPSWIPADGVVIFVPSVGGEGVDVIVTMFEEHARILLETAHSLQ